MVEFLFLDLDDTILDFHKAERIAISKTFRQFGIEPTREVLERYKTINIAHWQMLERGELTRDQVLLRRFEALFEEYGMNCDAEAVARSYEANLSIGHFFLPGAEEAVERLSKKYRLFLASNGTAKVQAGRMTSANLYRFFEKVFVSEEIGHNKPSKMYFDLAFAQIPGFDPSKAMIVGDSLTSDIKGGINAGIRTCWVNPKGLPGDPAIPADYQIPSLAHLESLLETL